jgi:hypothetical protein
MTDELMRTSPSKLLATLDGSGFDNFGGGDIFMKILVGLSS